MKDNHDMRPIHFAIKFFVMKYKICNNKLACLNISILTQSSLMSGACTTECSPSVNFHTLATNIRLGLTCLAELNALTYCGKL
jgi:hypothetical protein